MRRLQASAAGSIELPPQAIRTRIMAFPPNYNQERNNRARDKQRKAQEKLAKREEKSAQRKMEREGQPDGAASNDEHKD
jgi:hypothetical protein